jgi:predicted nucleic acid-binding protein
MVTGAGDPLFLDTNILVYSSESRAPFHTVAIQTLQEYYRLGTELWVSRQVLRQYVATLTRPQLWGNPEPLSRLIAEVDLYAAQFRVAEDNSDVTDQLLTLLQQFPAGGKQIHDANIVATMQTYGIPRLLTHNGADFARYASIITVIPLVSAR